MRWPTPRPTRRYDGVIWETAISMLLRLQRAAGCHLHILHTQTSGSVELIRQAKRRGQKVTCEINPWALFLGCDWSAIERLGSYALSYWVPEKNVPGLWEGLGDGTIDIVATDHAPHTREEKEIGWTDGWKAHTGTPSTQFYLSMFLTAALEGKIKLERVVEATSTAPARHVRPASARATSCPATTPIWCWSIWSAHTRSATPTC